MTIVAKMEGIAARSAIDAKGSKEMKVCYWKETSQPKIRKIRQRTVLTEVRE